MSLLRTFNPLTSSVNDSLQGRSYTSIYTLGQRFNFPASDVLHDICEFSIQRPNGAPDNYRLYTPSTNTYGIEVVSSDAQDTLTGEGVQRIRVRYLDSNWELQSVDVDMNGTTPVTVVASGVRRVNDFFSIQTGITSVAEGDIMLQTTTGSSIEAPWTGQQTLGMLTQGGNKDMTAVFTVPENKEVYITEINVSSANSDQSVRVSANVDPISRELVAYNCFLFQSMDLIGSNSNASQGLNFLKFPSRADIKISASPTATGADTSCHVVMAMLDKVTVIP